MHTLSISTLILSFWLSFSPTTPPESSLNWLIGDWQGTGLQILPADHTWKINFSYFPGHEGPFIINYPSIPCNGHWELESNEYHRVVFTERITKGYFRCANNGKVIITYVDENHISFSYFLSGE